MLASIFYNRSRWNHLIKEVIEPFIKEQSLIENWCLYFSRIQGDHITLAINMRDTSNCKGIFADVIGQYLSATPSENKKTTYPLQTIFMDYPNNSVYFNKSKQLVHSWYNNKYKVTHQHISQAMIGALRNDPIDTESIYTFLIYMQLGMIKAVYPDILQALVKFQSIIKYLDSVNGRKNDLKPENNSEDLICLEQLFENNKQIMPEIIRDVWSANNNDPSLMWLYAWISASKNFITKGNFSQDFILLSNMLCRHLGLNDRAMTSLSCQLIVNAFHQITNSSKSGNTYSANYE